MDSFEFKNVKAEKVQAMRNYNRQKMLKTLELFTALALLGWSFYNYTPVAADFLRHNVAVFGHPLYVFIAVNILTVVISVLSSQKPTTKQDLYDEYVTITKALRRSSAEEHKPAPEVPVSEKQIVCVDNVVISPVDQNTVGAAEAITTTSTIVKECEPDCPVHESSVVSRAYLFRAVLDAKQSVDAKQTINALNPSTCTAEYRRTRTERLDWGKGNMRELMRRSETLIRRNTEVKMGRRSWDQMDDLSSEEFRMTIETFIAAKKKTLIKENTLDLKLHKKHSVALTFESN